MYFYFITYWQVLQNFCCFCFCNSRLIMCCRRITLLFKTTSKSAENSGFRKQLIKIWNIVWALTTFCATRRSFPSGRNMDLSSKYNKLHKQYRRSNSFQQKNIFFGFRKNPKLILILLTLFIFLMKNFKTLRGRRRAHVPFVNLTRFLRFVCLPQKNRARLKFSSPIALLGLGRRPKNFQNFKFVMF